MDFFKEKIQTQVVLLGIEPRLGESESPVITYYTIRPDSI
jgi:hypothetical protein